MPESTFYHQGNGLEFRILGPLEVRRNGKVIPITAPRLQAVLAVLLIQPGVVVSVGRISHAIWGDEAPASAVNQIHICISRIRSALEAAGADDGVIATRRPGYVLETDGAWFDIEARDRLVELARERLAADDTVQAVAHLRTAIGLCRGPALSGIESDHLRPDRHRLEEEGIALREECVALGLRLGRHSELVPELVEMTASHPLREHAWVQLMTALSRCGRTAEALRVYHDTAQLLRRELGVDPGEALRQAHAALLATDATGERLDGGDAPDSPIPLPGVVVAGDSAAAATGALLPPSGQTLTLVPEPAARAPCMLPGDLPDFTGRETELAALRAVLRTGDAAVPVAVVSGPGGTGKTTLALHTAHLLRERFRDGQLYVDLRGAEPAEVLARFLRELGVPGPMVPDRVEARAEMYRAVIADRRVLVVLDDAACSEQVQHLFPGTGSCAVLVTCRSRMVFPGSTAVEIGVFDVVRAAALMSRIIGPDRAAAEPRALSEIIRLCGGLPLAVRIAGAKLAAHPHWPVSMLAKRLAQAHDRLDQLSHGHQEVRAGLTLTYEELPPDARCLFRRLALLEIPDFASWVGAALLSVSEDRAEQLFDELAQAGLLDVVQADDAGHVRYRLHDLVRLFALERGDEVDSQAERNEAVARAGGAWLSLFELNHIRICGGDYAALHGPAVRVRLDISFSSGHVCDPVGWYESERVALACLIRQTAKLGLSSLCWDLASSGACLYSTLSDHEQWQQAHEHALVVSRRCHDRRGEAVALLGLGGLYVAQRAYAGAQSALSEAGTLFLAMGDDHGLGLVLRQTALVHRVHGEYDQALAGLSESHRLLRGCGDFGALVHALRWTAQIFLERGEVDLAVPYLEEALELTSRLGARAVAQVRLVQAEVSLLRGRHTHAEREFSRVLHTVREMRDCRGQAHALLGLGRTALARGHHREARQRLMDGLMISRRSLDRLLEAQILLSLGEVFRRAGDAVTAETMIRRSVVLFRALDARGWLIRALDQLARTLDREGVRSDGQLVQH